MSGTGEELSGYTKLAEPVLLFAEGGRHKHPLLGLLNHGPYGLQLGALTTLRFALVALERDMGKLRDLVEELEKTVSPREATNYYPQYPGFRQVFRAPIAPLDERVRIIVPETLDAHAKAGAKRDLARDLFQCVSQLKAVRGSFDVALIYLPPDWSSCFEGENFNFHDFFKSLLRTIEHSGPDPSGEQLRARLPCKCDVGAERCSICQGRRRSMEADRAKAGRGLHRY